MEMDMGLEPLDYRDVGPRPKMDQVAKARYCAPCATEVVKSHRCPRCGSTLITNGRVEWCTFVGGGGVQACAYGIDRQQPLR